MVIHAGKQFAFGDILDFLPKCDPFPVAQSLPSGARYVTDGVPGFIDPIWHSSKASSQTTPGC